MKDIDDSTKNIIEDLNNYVSYSNIKSTIESRGISLIESVVNLMDAIDENFDSETSCELQKRLINSIKNKDPSKFKKKMRQV